MWLEWDEAKDQKSLQTKGKKTVGSRVLVKARRKVCSRVGCKDHPPSPFI